MELIGVFKDISPILIVIFFFQYIVIKKPISHLHKIIIGILAFSLTNMGNNMLIYLFAFLIGFSTTMAEPALLAIAIKAEEISEKNIKQNVLRIIVAIGVAMGISLGAYRLILGDPIHYYIIVGYIFVIIFTYFAPKYIIAIAYDSGGVTTSTVTVPLVAALGLGLAENIQGRNPLIDGFGLIAFASLFPMLTVMGYGIYASYIQTKLKKGEHR